ncbi:MAG: pilus assembly protein [Planctomycetes bacterium]|nr:pilus assembly protein [Planctomycetota bacterium]
MGRDGKLFGQRLKPVCAAQQSGAAGRPPLHLGLRPSCGDGRPSRREPPLRCGRGVQGQALVEFALIAPVQLLFILFLIQAAHVLVARQVVAFASHAATRAVLVGLDPHQAAAMVCTGLHPVRHGQGIVLPGWSELGISEDVRNRTRVSVLRRPGASSGEVRVTVEHDFRLIVPVVNRFFSTAGDSGGTLLTLRSESVTHKPWSEDVEGLRGHPVIPDLPWGAGGGNPP